MTDIKKFFEQTMKEERAQALLATYEKPDSEEGVCRIYAEIAAQLGVEITTQQIAAYLAQDRASGELDDEELAQLTGGGDHAACKQSFKDKENCWWKDACDLINSKYDGYQCKRDFDGTYTTLYV